MNFLRETNPLYIIVIYTNLYVKQTLFHCQPALKPALSFFNVSLSKPIIEYNQLGDLNLLVSVKPDLMSNFLTISQLR